jgi:hypothetical protein
MTGSRMSLWAKKYEELGPRNSMLVSLSREDQAGVSEGVTRCATLLIGSSTSCWAWITDRAGSGGLPDSPQGRVQRRARPREKVEFSGVEWGSGRESGWEAPHFCFDSRSENFLLCTCSRLLAACLQRACRCLTCLCIGLPGVPGFVPSESKPCIELETVVDSLLQSSELVHEKQSWKTTGCNLQSHRKPGSVSASVGRHTRPSGVSPLPGSWQMEASGGPQATPTLCRKGQKFHSRPTASPNPRRPSDSVIPPHLQAPSKRNTNSSRTFLSPHGPILHQLLSYPPHSRRLIRDRNTPSLRLHRPSLSRSHPKIPPSPGGAGLLSPTLLAAMRL